MSFAEYAVVARGRGWAVVHDGNADNEYATKEAAFEAAVAAAGMAMREGHEIRISVPGRTAGNTTASG
jgi:hypothetical protein